MTLFKKKPKAEPPLHCPRDGTAMKKIQKGDIIIDVCDTCSGMWLDKHEVKQLAALARGRK